MRSHRGKGNGAIEILSGYSGCDIQSLADPACRTLLDALPQRGGQSLAELPVLLEMSLLGVIKHLSVQESAGLIVPRKKTGGSNTTTSTPSPGNKPFTDG